MGTDIAGDVAKEKLEYARRDIEECFRGTVDGFFNARPAKYEVGAHTWECYSHIELSQKLMDNPFDFIEKQYWKSFAYFENRPYIQDAAFFFPHHKLAKLHFFFNAHPSGEDKVRKLGYIPVKHDEATGIWNNAGKLKVLAALRDPESGLRAVDTRAAAILQALGTYLRPQPSAYTFAVYRPKWTMKPPNEYFSGDVCVRPVRELVETPASWAEARLEQLCKGLGLANAVGLASTVATEDGQRHIPMVDFAPDACFEGVRSTLDRLGMRGMLIESGNSYHFYGFDLLDEHAWKAFAERTKDMAGSVDLHYPELQLEQGFAMLRLTPAKGKLFQPCFCEYYPEKPTGTDSARATPANERALQVA